MMSTFVIEFEFKVAKVHMLTQLQPPINDVIRISTWLDKIDKPGLSPNSMATRGVGSNGTRVPDVTGTNIKTLLRFEVSPNLEWLGFRDQGLGFRLNDSGLWVNVQGSRVKCLGSRVGVQGSGRGLRVSQKMVGPRHLFAPHRRFISQKVFIKSFFKSQFPHKSVNLPFTITIVKNKSTHLCGN